MANKKLTTHQLNSLRQLEKRLKCAVRSGDSERAIHLAIEIQALFPNDRTHHRLLRAKLWAFEACLSSNRLAYATNGFNGIRKLSGETTRLYLETTSLLAVCFLRQKKTGDAKQLIQEVVGKLNNINSDRRRRQFQRRLIERIEEECILAEMIGTQDGEMDAEQIQEQAILFLQRKSDDEILRLIGNNVPVASVKLLSDIRDYSINQLSLPDRNLLPPPRKAEAPREIGKKTFAVLRRIVWKTFCSPNSGLYKLWSKQVPKVFNGGYFSAAIVTTLGEFRIGAPLVTSGVVALAMKYGAEEFCDWSKPNTFMTDRNDKAA